MTDITLIPTQDLINEVFNRFDSMIIMGVQSKVKKGTDKYFRQWAGGDATCLGLLEILKAVIENDYLKEMENKGE